MKCRRCNGTGIEADPETMRSRRETAGLNQKQLATKLNISASYLCDLEQGRRDWHGGLLQAFDALESKLKQRKA